MKAPLEAPRLLLSARSLTGVSLATRDRLLEVVARYREHETLAVTFSKAVDAGVDGVLVAPVPVVCAALKELKKVIPTFVMVPTLTEHERHQLEPGIESVLSRVPPGQRAALGWGAWSRSAPFGRGDVAARLPALIDLELSRIPARDVRGVVLDAWLTDLALAAGHRRFFESYSKIVHRHRAVAGLETHNLGVLLQRLEEWDVRPDFVLGPLNPVGLVMKPTPEETLDRIARSKVPVVAKELRAGGVAGLDQACHFAIERGAHGLAVDLAEIDEMAPDLARCVALLGVKSRAG